MKAALLCAVFCILLLFQSGTAQNFAEPCNATVCQLPNCRCATEEIPGNLPIHEVPQIVTISFDDSFRVYDYDTYYSPIFNGRKNPNGCQIGITFFNTHQYTDYSLVEHAHRSDGYEFASHSITHRSPTTWWQEATALQWTNEILDQKKTLSEWGGIPSEKIRGFRAPFLVTSETELKVLKDNDFLYDASMGSFTPYWPFTLDYKSPLCNAPSTCPDYSYPGLWIVPHLYYKQSSGYPCSMLDACTAPFTEEQWYQFLVENFETHYNGNRSPFGIYSHSAWFFGGQSRVNAMNRFLNEILEMHNVYVVTHTQMLEWVRNPTPLSQIQDFAPWMCPPVEGPRCSYSQAPGPTCSKTFTTPIYNFFKSCTTPCPNKYPGFGNPLGS